ncbi:unnamed protein product [Lathyrus sativus]|nr:unnamed protein product [Lathyrus sativus]
MDNKRHFVLVHGASHGAWCWYKLVTLLKSSGHKVTALDLAASGINPKQVLELNSVAEYYEPLIDFIRSLPQEERVILVGHSFGGICTSMAMEFFPKKIAVGVFVASVALTPEEGSNSKSKSIFEDSLNNILRGSMILGPEFIASHMYQLSPPEDFSLAMSLLRPMNTFDDQELFKEQTTVTKDNLGSVAKVFVVGKEDKMLTQNPGNDAKVIPDADHMILKSGITEASRR